MEVNNIKKENEIKFEEQSPDMNQLPNIFIDNELSEDMNNLSLNSDISKGIFSDKDFNFNNIFNKNTNQDSSFSSTNDIYNKQKTYNLPNIFNSNGSQDTEIEKNNSIFSYNANNIISKSMPEQKVPKNPAMDLFYSMEDPSSIKLTKRAILSSLKNQATTKILQKIVNDSDKVVIESILSELKGEFRDIMKDKNGNYFCSDLIKVCDQSERIKILEEIHLFLSEECVNNFATHPIQTLIEFSSSEREYTLILASFNDYNKLLFASLDPNGAYVIQKIIERIPEKYRTQFNNTFITFISFVSMQKFGIITVKKFISCTKNTEIMAEILKLIYKNFMCLAVNKYGNYLIQFLLEKWRNIPEGKAIKQLIINHFKILSESKYSSFICELFFKYMNKEEYTQLLNSLDLNDIKKTNNPYSMKIIKSLGIFNNSGNNINEDCQNNINLPMNLNNYNQINDNSPNFNNQNLMNFGNNMHNNFDNKHYKNNKYNNNKTKYKKKNNSNNDYNS